MVLLVLLTGCASYGRITTTRVPLGENFVEYHVIRRSPRSTATVVFLNGSRVGSALGKRSFGLWTELTFAHYLNEHLPPEWELVVPEVQNVAFGDGPRSEPEVLMQYTLPGRIDGATAAIDDYLATSESANLPACIVGYSEGGQILPSVYLGLERRHRITKLVGMSYGGMSHYDAVRVLRDEYPSLPPAKRARLATVEEQILRIDADPDSIERGWIGWPYRRWSTFGPYRPLDELLTIDIPILLLHGDQDLNMPVESSRLVVEEFRKAAKSNLDYREYPGYDHSYNGDFERVVGDIVHWIRKAAESSPVSRW